MKDQLIKLLLKDINIQKEKKVVKQVNFNNINNLLKIIYIQD